MARPLIVSSGCPASIGPEISVRAAARQRGTACVLVGDKRVLQRAAELVGVNPQRLCLLDANDLNADASELPSGLYLMPAGPKLRARDSRPGKPTEVSGRAQLAYVEEAYRLSICGGGALVTAAVSKAAIAGSGDARAASFRGHTEWLSALDGARGVTMCFLGKRLSSALVTTHLPLSRVARAITPARVCRSVLHLVEALRRAGKKCPRIAVCSLNPHAGEDELLGTDEQKRIVPGINAAREQLGTSALISGPIGAETAFRFAFDRKYDGVVAMYHDQATIPMKLVAFGDAVNLTMGLSCIRTSVDHGTAYDIAWQGVASDRGMCSAMALARRLEA